jgi:DNA-binding NtrC family response regulator
MKKQKLLVVDDELDMLEGLLRVLTFDLEAVEIAVSAAPLEVMGLLKEQGFDLVLLDVRMPDMDGMALLEAMQQLDPRPTVIMMTAYGDIETAVSAIKKGAYDFITKPFEIPDLVRLLKKGLERSRLIGENLTLRRQVSEKAEFEEFMGQSAPVQRLFETVKSLANTDYAVLIRGESGTGKELVARAIHALSRRGPKALVAVNCPAIPEHLLESELFGHEKGAFTGALAYHRGLFEEANGSSLLLDEIADIPVTVQTKMLRVLQEQEIRPLGSNRGFQVDFHHQPEPGGKDQGSHVSGRSLLSTECGYRIHTQPPGDARGYSPAGQTFFPQGLQGTGHPLKAHHTRRHGPADPAGLARKCPGTAECRAAHGGFHPRGSGRRKRA